MRMVVVLVPMLMMMIVAMLMIMTHGRAACCPYAPCSGSNGASTGKKPRAEPAQHILDHVIAANAQPIANDLHLDMPIADMPGEPRQFLAAGGGNFDQGLRPADDAHDAAVVEHESVAVAQSGRARQVEQKGRAALAGQDDPAAMPVVRIEQNLIDCTGAVPMAGRLDGVCALHVVLSMIRKSGDRFSEKIMLHQTSRAQ